MPPQIVVRQDGTLALESQDQGFRATGVPGGTSPMYGLGGLFGICDADPVVINAMVGPIGIEQAFTWRGSDVQHPFYESLVDMQNTNYNQASKCGDCGTPVFKQCTQTAVFGRICQQTNEHAVDDLGLRAHVTTPRVTLFGSITDPSGNVLIAQGQEITDMFTLELAAAAYFLRMRNAWMMWNGNPLNNAGGALQYPGIPLIINTGKVDTRLGVACPALDSQVPLYNAVVGAAGSPNLTNALAGMLRSIQYRIGGMNKSVEGANQFFAMHHRLWDCVARQMTCEYGLVCNTATDRNDAWDMRELYNRMMDTHSIPIDGKWYKVYLDNMAPVTPVSIGNDTGFRGDIYFFTERLEGETIFWGEYQDLQKTAGAVLAWFRRMFGSTPVSITDGGRYAWAPTTFGGFCFDARVIVKPRLLCKMPQIQGRLRRVTCVPLGTYPAPTGSGLYGELNAGGIYSKPYMGLYGYGAGAAGQVPPEGGVP